MGNKEYRDLEQLRRDVVALIQERRYEFTIHARTTHSEIPAEAKIAAVLHGGQDQPNLAARSSQPSYVCWYEHPAYGLLRAVYAVVEPPVGGQVLLITVFPE